MNVATTSTADPSLLGPASRKSATSVWMTLFPVIAAMAYPLCVKAMFVCTEWAKTLTGAPSFAGFIGAIGSAALAWAISGLALRALIVLRKSAAPSAARLRLVLHFAFAGPPLFILLGIPAAIFALSVAGKNGAPPEQQIALLLWWRDLFWWLGWALVALVLLVGKAWARALPETDATTPRRRVKPGALGARLRAFHRYAALVVVLAFLALHLGNHLLALWSLEAQDTAMRALRIWYRAPGVEAAILIAFGAGALAGLILVLRWVRTPGDVYRTLQTSSGFYLALFLANHVLAVFRNRGTGRDTNWSFATGGDPGILGSEAYVAVFLYYIPAILCVAVHLGTGLRMVLLSRGARPEQAGKVVAASGIIGAVVAALTAAALVGVRLSVVFS